MESSTRWTSLWVRFNPALKSLSRRGKTTYIKAFIVPLPTLRLKSEFEPLKGCRPLRTGWNTYLLSSERSVRRWHDPIMALFHDTVTPAGPQLTWLMLKIYTQTRVNEHDSHEAYLIGPLGSRTSYFVLWYFKWCSYIGKVQHKETDVILTCSSRHIRMQILIQSKLASNQNSNDCRLDRDPSSLMSRRTITASTQPSVPEINKLYPTGTVWSIGFFFLVQ